VLVVPSEPGHLASAAGPSVVPLPGSFAAAVAAGKASASSESRLAYFASACVAAFEHTSEGSSAAVLPYSAGFLSWRAAQPYMSDLVKLA